MIKLEKELDSLRTANSKLNKRIGDEIIADDSDGSIPSDDDDFPTTVNTQHYQVDQQFSGKYYFLTNVSMVCKCIFLDEQFH